ncbi:MAG: glycosyltransferase family 39 protein [Nanoarchaeota archaeon]|nr:glycosyltransferase family 39 protein [Nanoarchaeota archaeon]
MKITKTKIFLSIIIIIHLTFIFFSAGQLYYGDYVYFITAAKEIASGHITGHFGYLDGRLDQNMSSMLIHPPTYVYLLSLFIYLFGENTYSIRSVSTLFAIGVIILIYLITKRILKTRDIEESEKWALIAAFIYAINPMTIQNSILVDIDGGLLNFFVLLFIYLYISKKNLYYLVPSLFMVFASKMLAPMVLFASLLLLNLGAKNYKEIFRVIKLFIIAGGSFFLSFILYASLFNLGWRPLFFHNSILTYLGYFINSPFRVLFQSLWGFKTFFYFATPFLIFLFIIVSYKILKNTFEYKTDYINKNKDLILLWIYAIITLAIIFLSGISGWNFTKHHIAAIPSAIILIIYFTPKKIINIEKAIPLILITSLLLLGYFIIFLGDPIIPEIEGRVATTSFIEVAKPVLIRILLYGIIPIFLCWGLIRRIPKKKIWLTLFFLVIFTSIYLDIIQAKADYSTHNLYGDRGLEEVIDFMQDKPPEQILCYVHVVYFLDYKETYELTSLYYNKPKLMETLPNINWIILYPKDITLIGKDTLKDFELEKEIGSYKILKRKNR